MERNHQILFAKIIARAYGDLRIASNGRQFEVGREISSAERHGVEIVLQRRGKKLQKSEVRLQKMKLRASVLEL
jgi:hypothetical protein